MKNTPAIRITVLVENTSSRSDLVAEHGFACWVEAGNKNILFDTGQTNAVVENARTLGIDLSTADTIILSHGHYDHTGGLKEVVRLAPQAQIFAHPAAFLPKFGRAADGTLHSIGAAYRPCSGHISKVTDFTMIAPGVHITGEIPHLEKVETASTRFFLDDQAAQRDPLVDDQAIVFDTAEGLIVLLGCAHAGVINTLHHVCNKLPGNQRIHAVLGGMHLGDADPSRIHWTVEKLTGFGIRYISPAHCTGENASAAIHQRWLDRCKGCAAGTVHQF